MSQQNVELVRRSWQAYADLGLDGRTEFFGDNINWRDRGRPGRGGRHAWDGRDASLPRGLA